MKETIIWFKKLRTLVRLRDELTDLAHNHHSIKSLLQSYYRDYRSLSQRINEVNAKLDKMIGEIENERKKRNCIYSERH